MTVREDLKYSKDHEWVKVEGDKAYIGITDYAQEALGDVVFVELPAVDDEFSKGDVIGVVESVKAASDIYTPVSGRVIEVNTELEDSPENINSDPYGSWMAVLEMSDPDELNDLMDADEYEIYCQGEK